MPSNSSRDRARGPHFSLQVDGTVTFTAAGRHQVKGGVQFDRVGIDGLSGLTGNVINLFWGQAFDGVAGAYGYYSVVSNDLLPNRGVIIAGKATVNNVGLFLQDEWTLGSRLTLQVGLRTENEHVPSLADDPNIPPTAIHFGFSDKLAPRLGLAWDATGDRKTKVYGSWGVFHDITKLQITQSFGGLRGSNLFWFTLDSPDFRPIVDNPACPPACPGSLILGEFSPIVPLNHPDAHAIDPALAQMRLQELVIGVERELAPALSASARYIHKQIDRALEDLTTQLPGETEPLFLIGNPGFGAASEFYPGGGSTPLALPKAVRDYDALEVTLDRRLSGRWAARAAYTWSRLSGNYSGLALSDEDGRVAPNVGGVFDAPIGSFDERGQPVYGVLATDRPHQVKVQGLYTWPFGTSVGGAWYGATGIPRTRRGHVQPGHPGHVQGTEERRAAALPLTARSPCQARSAPPVQVSSRVQRERDERVQPGNGHQLLPAGTLPRAVRHGRRAGVLLPGGRHPAPDRGTTARARRALPSGQRLPRAALDQARGLAVVLSGARSPRRPGCAHARSWRPRPSTHHAGALSAVSASRVPERRT